MKKLAGVLAGAWLGLQLGVGYLVAPVLFQNLERMQAGALAGVLFTVTAYIGMFVWLLVYFTGRSEQKRAYARAHTGKWILLLLALLAVNQFLITPVIEAHKTGTANWLLTLLGGSFGRWHGTSTIIYMVCSVLGLGLVFRLVKMEWR
ncbi:MAG: DUF4149 domain-containing protein [Neisseria sp.]|uniref:DUF4149 domain-containing protein n=2 Tax=Neisseriaceae TaxID=481 RepID=UPI0026DAC576|nr:DUF4149 domain-containing protein [Neisseria sp.]MDO4226902.1 DUF4149 domain-containing protein [Neisseria sp.]